MLGTNRQFASLLRHLDQQIAALERGLLEGKLSATIAPTLEQLWTRRRSVKLLLLNRRVEASRHIVDFGKWRDGNGALGISIGGSRATGQRRLG